MSALPFHPLIPNMQALGFTKRGLPIWPVMGGSEAVPPVPPAPPGVPGQPAPPAPPGTPPPGEPDRGYPANTPLVEMNADQREAYYKFHNRKAEERLDQFKGVTPEQVQQMQQRLEELESAQLTADQKALKDAEKAARAAADAEWGPKYLRSELKSLVSSVITDKEQRDAFMAVTDPKLFVGDNGEISEDKVMGHLTALFGKSGATGGGNVPPPQQFDWGQGGNGSGVLPDTKPGDGGRAEAARRREKQQQQKQ